MKAEWTPNYNYYFPYVVLAGVFIGCMLRFARRKTSLLLCGLVALFPIGLVLPDGFQLGIVILGVVIKLYVVMAISIIAGMCLHGIVKNKRSGNGT